MKKTIGFLAVLAALILLPIVALADSVPVDAAHFPDPNFRAYLYEQFGGEISESEQ